MDSSAVAVNIQVTDSNFIAKSDDLEADRWSYLGNHLDDSMAFLGVLILVYFFTDLGPGSAGEALSF